MQALRNMTQAGYTLIEVLIALVVISIGMLGMAGLQVSSLKQNQSAYMRSQATLLAYDIVDRMRANIAAVDNGDYFAATSKAVSTCSTTAGCSDSDMAATDLAQWREAIALELPSGNGRVCRGLNPEAETAGSPACASNNNSALPIVVFVWWNDERSKDEVSTQLAISTEL
ncbi:MAG: type IV pilus modification protein PilV [Pontibacterium sp.]